MGGNSWWYGGRTTYIFGQGCSLICCPGNVKVIFEHGLRVFTSGGASLVRISAFMLMTRSSSGRLKSLSPCKTTGYKSDVSPESQELI